MSNLIHSILPKPARPIIYVHPDMSVHQCIDMMQHENIGALVVTDDENFLGIVSERDVVYGFSKKGKELLESPVSEILWANVAVLKPTDTVETAMAIIIETKRRHVLVAESGKLVAIVSIGDLLNSILADRTRTIKELENYIHQ